jgi:hypothetical protein
MPEGISKEPWHHASDGTPRHPVAECPQHGCPPVIKLQPTAQGGAGPAPKPVRPVDLMGVRTKQAADEVIISLQKDVASLNEDLGDAMVEAHGLRAQVALLKGALRFVRQTVHQAHHEGDIKGCAKNTCRAITQALEEEVL